MSCLTCLMTSFPKLKEKPIKVSDSCLKILNSTPNLINRQNLTADKSLLNTTKFILYMLLAPKTYTHM